MSIQKISTSIFALLLAFAFNINASPLNIISSTTSLDAASSVDYDGKDYFRAIYFGDGPVANHIPATRDISLAKYTSDRTLISNANKFQEDLINQIEDSNKSFFDDFQGMMTSKNHSTVQQGIEMGAAEIQRVLELNPDFKEMSSRPELQGLYNTLGDDLSPEEAQQVVNKYLAEVPEYTEEAQARLLCAAAAIAIAGAVAVVIWKYLWFWDSAVKADHSVLLKEQIVDSVVRM